MLTNLIFFRQYVNNFKDQSNDEPNTIDFTLVPSLVKYAIETSGVYLIINDGFSKDKVKMY
jgi:hypothetical protein